MELYKNTEWLEVTLNKEKTQIPNDWKHEKINKLFTLTSSKRVHAKEYVNKGIPFFRGTEITNKKKGVEKFETFISDTYFNQIKNKYGIPKIDDFLITAVGTVGSVLLIEKEFDFYFKDGNIIWLKNKNSDNKKYLEYFFNSEYVKNKIYGLGNGSAYNALSIQNFGDSDCFLPKCENEQNAIASLLSTQESIVQKTKNLIANIEKRNQFMMDELLSGRLRVKEENGQPVFYRNPDDNWNEIKINGEDVNIPKDWDKYFLGSENIPFVKSGVKKYEGFVDYYATGEVNDFSLGEQPTGNFSYDKKPSRANVRVLDNTIYLARMKNTFKIIKFEKSEKFLLSTGFLGLQPNVKNVSLDYLYYTVRSDDFQKNKNKECKGATQETLSDGAAEKIEILIPCIEEQILIANTLKSMFNELEKYNKILEKEEKTFTFLLEELMSGRLRIKI